MNIKKLFLLSIWSLVTICGKNNEVVRPTVPKPLEKRLYFNPVLGCWCLKTSGDREFPLEGEFTIQTYKDVWYNGVIFIHYGVSRVRELHDTEKASIYVPRER